MWRFARKYWKRLLFAATAVVIFPLMIVVLLFWDSRPKPNADVSVHYLETLDRGGSNVVAFAVTNRSEFLVGHIVAFWAPDETAGDVWWPHYLSGSSRPWPGPLSQTPGKSNSIISVAAYRTNAWKVQLLGSDSRPEILGRTRAWIAWRLRKLDFDWSWKLQCRIPTTRVQVDAFGPEMLGDAPAP